MGRSYSCGDARVRTALQRPSIGQTRQARDGRSRGCFRRMWGVQREPLQVSCLALRRRAKRLSALTISAKAPATRANSACEETGSWRRETGIPKGPVFFAESKGWNEKTMRIFQSANATKARQGPNAFPKELFLSKRSLSLSLSKRGDTGSCGDGGWPVGSTAARRRAGP